MPSEVFVGKPISEMPVNPKIPLPTDRAKGAKASSQAGWEVCCPGGLTSYKDTLEGRGGWLGSFSNGVL